jgi:predicted HAD superfamily Cof-like phosphohydrolase
MPCDMLSDVRAFHEKYRIDYVGRPRFLPKDLLEFRLKFLHEELVEYHLNQLPLPGGVSDGIVTEHLAKQLDSLVDLIYVAIGTAYLQGFDIEEAWRRVHAANMTKIRTRRAEDSTRHSVYDVVKPPNFVPPDHTDLVRDHAHSHRKVELEPIPPGAQAILDAQKRDK